MPHFRQQPKIQLASSKQNLYSAEEKFIGKRYIYLGNSLRRFNDLKTEFLKKEEKTENQDQFNLKTVNLNTYRFQKKADIFKR
jgi:hypothetical protein